MTHQPPAPANALDAIAAALDDYWITSDPAGPFNTTQAAAQIDNYLDGYGYTITTMHTAAALSAEAVAAQAAAARPGARCTCPPPSRAAVALTALLALTCLIACLVCFLRGEQTWAFAAVVGATAFTNETADSLRTRRAAR